MAFEGNGTQSQGCQFELASLGFWEPKVLLSQLENLFFQQGSMSIWVHSPGWERQCIQGTTKSIYALGREQGSLIPSKLGPLAANGEEASTVKTNWEVIFMGKCSVMINSYPTGTCTCEHGLDAEKS